MHPWLIRTYTATYSTTRFAVHDVLKTRAQKGLPATEQIGLGRLLFMSFGAGWCATRARLAAARRVAQHAAGRRASWPPTTRPSGCCCVRCRPAATHFPASLLSGHRVQSRRRGQDPHHGQPRPRRARRRHRPSAGRRDQGRGPALDLSQMAS